MLEEYQRVYASVDLDAILYNLDRMKKNCRYDTKILAVIKADGYGHGALAIARELESVSYVFGYAVATAEEAIELRKNRIQKPILILGYTFPYCYKDLVQYAIRPTVFQFETARKLSDLAVQEHTKCKIHTKIDTGMSRIGIFPDDTGLALIGQIMQLPGIEIEGIFTHFARADEKDKTFAKKQFEIFQNFVREVEKITGKIAIKHCSNSAGILELPEANMDLVRAGIAMYGLWPSSEMNKNLMALKPALEWKSHIVFLKELPVGKAISYGGTFETNRVSKIATIPVGYGDGYPRSLSNKGYVLVRGQKAKICGRVCMDQFMVDVTDIINVQENDEVTLIGVDGEATITMEEMGDISGRFNYEFACDMNKRVPRLYYKNGVLLKQ